MPAILFPNRTRHAMGNRSGSVTLHQLPLMLMILDLMARNDPEGKETLLSTCVWLYAYSYLLDRLVVWKVGNAHTFDTVVQGPSLCWLA